MQWYVTLVVAKYKNNIYGTDHMQHHIRKQILSKHSGYHQQAHTIKCECLVAIVLPVLVVMRALASPAITLAVASTYVNDVRIMALFNFHVIQGIISCDSRYYFM